MTDFKDETYEQMKIEEINEELEILEDMRVSSIRKTAQLLEELDKLTGNDHD